MYQAQHQQPPLSGAYYGPSIPPQPYSYQQRRRTCFGCLLSTIIKAFVAFCVAFGLAILILWIIYRPHHIKVTVNNASLTTFNLTTTNPSIISYNLTTDISIRNPNKKISIYYDWLEADAYYDGMRFGFVNLHTFYQGHKNTTVIRPAFAGSSAFVAGDSGVGDFQSDRRDGAFDIDVWLYGRIRYRFGSAVTRRYYARVKCELRRLPLLTGGSSGYGFPLTKCDVVDY